MPDWLDPQRDLFGASEPLIVSYRYWTKLYWATPPWLTKKMWHDMKEIYESTVEGEHVDHIVPLKGKTAWGLHVPWNLQVLPAGPNLSKSNHHWPDMWNEQLELGI